MSTLTTEQIIPRGPFSLEAAAGFGFGPTQGRAPTFDGAMRLAFPVDRGRGYAGAVLRQRELDGPVEVELHLRGGADPEAALAQAARIVSLDHDGEAFLGVGRRDSVIAALQARHHGQRPVLFHSPYEGAAWAIISARRPAAQGARLRAALSAELGESFELDGEEVVAFPQPDRLAELPPDVPGLPAEKAERLRGLALAAWNGQLDVARLNALGPAQAFADVQRLRGLGPFYAGLVVLRATGFADAPLLMPEPRVLTQAARLYGRPDALDLAELDELSEAWRPFRTWCTVLIRLGGDREFGPASAPRR